MTELVLNLHSGCNDFPFTSATSFPATSSRLGDSSLCPTLSTCLTESDLGGAISFCCQVRWKRGTRGAMKALLIDRYKPRCCIGILLPLFVHFEVHLHAWFGFGSDPPQSQSVQTRFWKEAGATRSLYLYSFTKCKVSMCFVGFLHISVCDWFFRMLTFLQ